MTASKYASQQPAFRGGGVVPATYVLPTADRVATWRARDYPAQTDNTRIPAAATPWVDTTNGLPWTQINAANNPFYRTAAGAANAFGKPCMRFNAAERLTLLRASAAILETAINSTDYTVCTVSKIVGAGGYTISNQVATSDGLVISVGSGAVRQGTANTGGGTKGGLQTGLSVGSLAVFFFTVSSTSHNSSAAKFQREYINGTCYGPTANSTPPTFSTNNWVLGALTSTGTNSATTDLLDVYIWGKEFTPAEVMSATGAIFQDYGQTIPWSGSFRVFTGDSITAGVSAVGTSPRDSMEFKVAATNGWALGTWTNLGIGGISAANQDTRASIDILPIKAVLAINGTAMNVHYMNFFNSRAVATLPTLTRDTYLPNLLAGGVNNLILSTYTDYNPINGSTANATAYGVFWDNAANRTGIQGYIPVHLNASIGVPGSYTTATSDGVHLQAASNTTWASLVSPVMAAF